VSVGSSPAAFPQHAAVADPQFAPLPAESSTLDDSGGWVCVRVEQPKLRSQGGDGVSAGVAELGAQKASREDQESDLPAETQPRGFLLLRDADPPVQVARWIQLTFAGCIAAISDMLADESAYNAQPTGLVLAVRHDDGHRSVHVLAGPRQVLRFRLEIDQLTQRATGEVSVAADHAGQQGMQLRSAHGVVGRRSQVCIRFGVQL